jgi:tryptophanyl-tRNA synthetase
MQGLQLCLTGIKPTGSAMHLGNEIGMGISEIKPHDLVFIADAHALTGANKSDVGKWSIELTKQLITLGCKGYIYRQSDIPEIFQLTWLLSHLVRVGQMNRMHAFKANNGDVTIGLYTYPILMAADILLSGARYIRVGQDQLQHLEVARILAERAKREYGFTLELPQPLLTGDESVPGLDGRKMSKSYKNTIPCICTREELIRLIASIKTDSTPADLPKKHETLFHLYSTFGSPSEIAELDQKYQGGVSWKEVKDIVSKKLWEHIGPRQIKTTDDQVRQIWADGRAYLYKQVGHLCEQIRQVYGWSV